MWSTTYSATLHKEEWFAKMSSFDQLKQANGSAAGPMVLETRIYISRCATVK